MYGHDAPPGRRSQADRRSWKRRYTGVPGGFLHSDGKPPFRGSPVTAPAVVCLPERNRDSAARGCRPARRRSSDTSRTAASACRAAAARAGTARDEASSSDPCLRFIACGLHGAPEPEQETRLLARRRQVSSDASSRRD
jgi:hypothetical protein